MTNPKLGQADLVSPVYSQLLYIAVLLTDLQVYNLDAVPHIHVVWNHVGTDKLTTANARNVYLELSQTQ